jgi:signal transduction histidine kinase
VTGAAILDPAGAVVVSSDPAMVGRTLAPALDLTALAEAGLIQQLRVIYSEQGQLELRTPMTLGNEAFGAIRIGVSTLLMRQEVAASLRPALITAGIALAVAVFVAAVLAQLLLRPIHVLRSGLDRLGRGEFGVTLDLAQGDEFGDLGAHFNEISQQLSAHRGGAGQSQDPKQLLQQTLAYSRKLVALGRLSAGIAHEVKNPLNAMAIHLELLRTKIRAGAKQAQPEPVSVPAGGLGLAEAARAVRSDPATENVMQHVNIIESEIRRLDEVVQGFLKFTRPEELRLQPVSVRSLFDEILPLVTPEAEKRQVKVVVEAAPTVPDVHGDAAMLRQAFLNLAINACQAMPNGGTLRLRCSPAAQNRVEVRVEDTGVGIPPQHLSKIFDLYFTTKDHGTGIGLSMVFRIVQMHDGDIEVQSTGAGTTFRVLLPRAQEG